MSEHRQHGPIEVRGPQPSASDTLADLLPSRLATFAKYAALALTFFLLFEWTLEIVSPAQSPEAEGLLPRSQILFTVPLVYAVTWAVARFGGPSRLAVNLLDGISTVLACGIFAHWGYISLSLEQAFPAISHALILRAAFLPSGGGRTLLISTLAVLPAMVYGFLPSPSPASELGAVAAHHPAGLLVRGVLWSVIAAVVSRVIYGLRREVSDARRLGQYTLEEKLGQGGMGEVYRARHALLSRPTAIKLISPEKASNQLLVRFEREVEATSRLTHPNTVAVYDYGRTPSGVFYYAMEFLPGLTLAQLVSRFGPQLPSRVIHLLTQVCGSLHEAHSLKILHRDIKPANLILCQRGGISDVVKVVDFGLAKDLRKDSGEVALTAPGIVIGTPLFLPPEALDSAATLDQRSDLYSLGAVSYFLLTGKPPFPGKNIVEIAMAQVSADPKRPGELVDQPISRDLEEVVLACLERDRSRRPRDAQAVAATLESCADAGKWTPAMASAWWKEHQPPSAAAAESM